MTLTEQARKVHDRSDLAQLLLDLKADLAAHPEDWENLDLPSFLEAMSAWLRDADGYYENIGADPRKLPPWRIAADIFMAGRVYE